VLQALHALIREVRALREELRAGQDGPPPPASPAPPAAAMRWGRAYVVAAQAAEGEAQIEAIRKEVEELRAAMEALRAKIAAEAPK
jgi:hypothetical protein